MKNLEGFLLVEAVFALVVTGLLLSAFLFMCSSIIQIEKDVAHDMRSLDALVYALEYVRSAKITKPYVVTSSDCTVTVVPSGTDDVRYFAITATAQVFNRKHTCFVIETGMVV